MVKCKDNNHILFGFILNYRSRPYIEDFLKSLIMILKFFFSADQFGQNLKFFLIIDSIQK